MERLLHYVWKYKLYTATPLITTEGRPVQVIDPGMQNTDAGPDFFNAKIKIDGTLWVGSVEIHDKSSDWLLHHHDTDKAYDCVILHIIGFNDFQPVRTNGNPIPQMLLTVPGKYSPQYRLAALPGGGSSVPRSHNRDRSFAYSLLDGSLAKRAAGTENT